jgi:hypothetical protein
LSLPHVSVGASAAGLALLAVGAVAYLLLRRRLDAGAPLLRLLLTTMVALQVVASMSDLYGKTPEAQTAVLQAVLLVLALSWDVVMSGEDVTNGESRWFPRHSRVLLYFGYTLLVTTAVLTFSSQRLQATGEPLESNFETELFARFGLLLLAWPLVLTIFLTRLPGLPARVFAR